MTEWLKKVFSESNGTPSSVRLLLGLSVFCAVTAVIYVLTSHYMTGKVIDLPPGMVSVINWTVSVLAGAKAASKFGENPPNDRP
jgi:predicted acyltransferase